MFEARIAVVLLAVCLAIGNCSTFHGDGRVPHDLTQCHYKTSATEPELVWKIGETIQMPNACCDLTCSSGLHFGGRCCGTVDISGMPGYELVSDMSKPYPDCCPKPQKVATAENEIV